jgi:Zn finger protein HypA/HybF involved in hydrogenase expression
MTLGNTASAKVRFIVWCRDCHHQVEPDTAELAARHGADTTVPDWRAQLICGRCGSRTVDIVVSGTVRNRQPSSLS